MSNIMDDRRYCLFCSEIATMEVQEISLDGSGVVLTAMPLCAEHYRLHRKMLDEAIKHTLHTGDMYVCVGTISEE